MAHDIGGGGGGKKEEVKAAPSSASSSSSSSSSSKGSLSSAGQNARAAIQAGRAGALANKQKQVGQTQTARYQASRAKAVNSGNAGTYRGAVNSSTAGSKGYGASGSMQGLQEGRESGRTPVEREQSVEDSHLQASILELARGAKGEAIKGDGTAYDYANQLIKMWNSGKDVVPVVKDGVVKWERGVERTGTRVFYDYDAKGNRIKTADKKLQDANNTAMWTDIDAWLNYANSGNLTRADNIKQSGRIAEYMRAIENGLMDNYDVEKQNGEKLSLYDYLGELFDLRDQLDVQARKQEGATALRYFAQQIDDVRTRMANGSDYDVSKLGADYDSLLKYTSQYSGDEDFAELFTALSNDYYKVYRNGLQTQVGDLDARLKAAQNAGLVAEQSVNSMNFNDVIVSDEDRQKIEANAEAARANTQSIFDQKTAAEDQLAWLDNEYRERNMTPEVAAAMERLSIAQLGKAYPDAHGKADAERMRQEDQALADEWNRSLELNPQYYNWQDRIAGVSKSFATRTAGSAANLAAWAANATTYENDEISEATQARDMAARAYLTDATPENKAALDAAEAALKQAQWNLATWQTERTGVAPKLESVANSLDARTQEEIAKAKEGASQLGQFGLDFLSTTMDMGFDALTGGGLKTMFARVAGSGIGEARRAGASSGEQLAYGLAQGAVEVLTEKLTDGLGAVYGKGISTDVVEKAISRLSSSDAGANFLRVLSGAIGEGGEEVVSDLLNPFTQWIIDEGARDNRVYDVDLSEALYDFLLGSAVGLIGQGGEVARGEYAAKNADIRQGDAEILEKAENAKATGQQLNSRDLSDLRAAQAREERQEVKGGLIIGPNGGLVAAPGVSGARSVTRGKNRHDTSTNVLAEGFENADYVNPSNPAEAYAAATTGAQGPRTDAEADQQSYAQEIEAEAERQAEEEEARKAEETKEANRKENTELEEQARIREQETEGAKRAAQAFQDEQNAQLKAAQEAEKYAQLAHNAREFQAEQDFLRQAQQARQAAEEAGRKAEEQMAMAESQSQAIEAQDGNVSPTPANQEEANQEIAGSQSAALAGQDTSPVEAPQKVGLATASETAPGVQATSAQANTQAEGIEAVKPTANEQGEVSTSIATAEEGRAAIESGETNNKTVAEVIPMVDKHVSESEPISTVAQNVFESRGSGKTPLSDRVANWIKSRFPTGVHSKAINGNVIVDKRGIKNDIAHGVGEAKAATFAAVPDVLDKGTIVSRSDGSVKSRSVTIAGKVMLNGSPVNVYCVVKQNSGDNRFYLHEVSDGNGTVFYKLGQNNNATPALLDSTGTNPASADVASTVSIAQNPQAGNSTIPSTVIGNDGTIGVQAQEGSENNGPGLDDSSVHGRGRGVGQENERKSAATGNDGLVSRLVSRSPRFTGETAKADKATWVKAAEAIERAGGKVLSQRELSPTQRYTAKAFKAITGKPMTYYDASGMGESAQVGSVIHGSPNAGAFVAVNHPRLRRLNGKVVNGPGTASLHESCHLKWADLGSMSRKFFVRNAVRASGISADEFNGIMGSVYRTYGFKYSAQARALEQLGVKTAEEWKKLSLPEMISKMRSVPDDVRAGIYEKMYEELANFSICEDARFLNEPGFDKLAKAMQTTAVESGLITQKDLDKGLRLAARLDEQAVSDKEAADAFAEMKANAKPISEFDPHEEFAMYELPYDDDGNAPDEKNVVAIRNTSIRNALRTFLNGGEAMPSIAITKIQHGHEWDGAVSFIYRAESIDPSINLDNVVYSGDAWTAMYPQIDDAPGFDEESREELATYLNSLVNEGDTRYSFVIPDSAKTRESFISELINKNKFLIKAAIANEGGFSTPRLREMVEADLASKDPLVKAFKKAFYKGGNYVSFALGDKEFDAYYAVWGEEDAEDGYDMDIVLDEFERLLSEEWYRSEFYTEIKTALEEAGQDGSVEIPTTYDAVIDLCRRAIGSIELSLFDENGEVSIDKAIPDAVVRPWVEQQLEDFDIISDAKALRTEEYDPARHTSFWDNHVPVTNENALKIMKAQPHHRSWRGDILRKTYPHLVKRFSGLSEIKNEKSRLKNETGYREEWTQAKEKLENVRELICAEITSVYADDFANPAYFDDYYYYKEKATDLIVKSATYVGEGASLDEGIEHALYDTHLIQDISETTIDKLKETFNTITDLPFGYFEAKPERIVGSSEVAAVIIPAKADASYSSDGEFGTDADALHELIKILDQEGVPYFEYEEGASLKKSRADIIREDLSEYLFEEPYLDEETQADQQAEAQKPQQVGRTPGRVKQSQDVNRSRTATKGETKAQFENNGETDYISRTNAQRSQTADLLTEDADPKVAQQKKDEQVRRLLTEDYAWTDDDVVIAQKLMFDMVKGIRDYQLHRSHKMSKEAFKRMTDQYNQLRDKHTRTLSESGQTLQANYMFSTGDKIVMKAAQTFLGFTKDGRFAGGSVNAKNATIYAGVEEASRRIQSAVDAKDVQSLAKICKDISDIRNVKKMFGPLGKFASEMENRVLDKIAKGENAAQNLEALAYGNLNAVCDDVQPYKALNAAKTIRVMNMLSNTATIVNNLANNFAQGAVSKSMVNQALSNLASKPFEALTGQQVISKAQRGREANKAVRNAQAEALETATLMQMYGITEENGRLELNDRGMFNPNINPFEQTMSLYKFLTGMGVEATDKMQAAGILKSMELGIDADIKAGKIEPHTKEQRMQEARHEVNRLLYKDDNSTTALVQHIRDFLNKFHVGNDRVGTIGLGDITMAFAKIPANVVRARLAMTPEGALLQVAQYAKGVNKAKRMHAEVLAKGIVDSYREQIDAANTALQSAYEMEWSPAKDAAIRKAQSELSRLNSKMWAEAQDACRGSVYRNLRTISQNYNENMMFDEAVERAGYMNAKEMSQFEAAQLSRKIGRAATSAGMMALGSVLRALGALRDFDQEPDDELRKMNSDKGYRGLMMNLSAIGRKNHEWKDGDLIIDGEFLEVIAMPLTIGATAAEAAATAQDAKTWSWLKSMAGNGIAKTFEAVGDIPGMADAINMYESLTSAYTTDYDEKVYRLGAGLLQYAANTIPSFFVPNSVSQATAGLDNKVRDVYAADTVWGQAKNIFMNKVPVLRNKVPVSVDVWGNERTYGEGPWGAINKMLLPGDVHVYRQNKYEAEIERLVREGYGNATPKTTVNSSFEVGDEKYTMTAQEKLDFKAARNSEQKELFEAFLDSKYYDQLNDAERMKVLQSLKTSAERDAKQDMLDSRQLNVQITRDKWETELLDVNDQIQFLTAKQLANNVLDRDAEDMDYAAVDQFLTGTYRGLSTTQRDLLNSSFSRLNDMYEAKSHYGISSETFNKGYDIYKDYMSQEGKDRVKGGYKDWEGSQMYTDIAKATGASEKQMDFFEDKFVLYNSNAVVPEKYNTLVDAGWGREAAQALVKNVADLTPTNGRKNVSYKQRLTAIATTSGLTEAQRWEAFYEYCPSSYTSVLKKMGKYRSNGFSLAKALKAAGKWDP